MRSGVFITALLLVVAAVGVARAQEDPARDKALSVYTARCGIKPESSQARGAPDAWAKLIETGHDPASLRALVDAIPCDCPQLTLEAAIRRAEYQVVAGRETTDCDEGTPGWGTWKEVRHRPIRVLPHIEKRRASSDPDDRITSAALGFRGLPLRYHSDYKFGAFAGIFALVNIPVCLGFAGISRESDDLARYATGTAACIAGFMTLLFGTLSGIAGLIVETNRDPLYLPPPRGTGERRTDVRINPTGLTLRF